MLYTPSTTQYTGAFNGYHMEQLHGMEGGGEEGETILPPHNRDV